MSAFYDGPLDNNSTLSRNNSLGQIGDNYSLEYKDSDSISDSISYNANDSKVAASFNPKTIAKNNAIIILEKVNNRSVKTSAETTAQNNSALKQRKMNREEVGNILFGIVKSSKVAFQKICKEFPYFYLAYLDDVKINVTEKSLKNSGYTSLEEAASAVETPDKVTVEWQELQVILKDLRMKNMSTYAQGLNSEDYNNFMTLKGQFEDGFSAHEDLVTLYLPLVFDTVRNFMGKNNMGVNSALSSDLVSAGSCGLVRAIIKFDSEKSSNGKFEPYAEIVAESFMKRDLSEKTGLPIGKVQEAIKVKKMVDKRDKSCINPDYDEIASELNKSKPGHTNKDVEELINNVIPLLYPSSLENLLSSNDDKRALPENIIEPVFGDSCASFANEAHMNEFENNLLLFLEQHKFTKVQALVFIKSLPNSNGTKNTDKEVAKEVSKILNNILKRELSSADVTRIRVHVKNKLRSDVPLLIEHNFLSEGYVRLYDKYNN